MKYKKSMLKAVLLMLPIMVALTVWGIKISASEHNEVLTSMTVVDDQDNPLTKEIGMWDRFRIMGTFKLPDSGVKKGDTTRIEYPDKIRYSSPNTTFEMRSPDGNVIANVSVDPTTRIMTLTYTDYAENQDGVSGRFHFDAQINFNVLRDKQRLAFDFGSGDRIVKSNEVTFSGIVRPVGTPIVKSGWLTSNDSQSISYYIAINRNKANLSNLVFMDQLQNVAGQVDLSTLSIWKGDWQVNAQGVDFELVGQRDVTNQYKSLVEVSGDGQSFKIPFGTVGSNEGFILRYQVRLNYKPIAREVFDNRATITADNGVRSTVSERVTYDQAGGQSEGYQFTIQVRKENEEGLPLANARFQVIRKSNQRVVGTITTDATGTGRLTGLLQTDYQLKEIQAPQGYELSTELTEVSEDEFVTDKTAVKTIVNHLEKTEFVLTKKWEGDQPANRPEVSFQLKRDGQAYGVAKTINAGAEDVSTLIWKDLPKYQEDNKTLSTYSVEEVSVPSGYTVQLSDETGTSATITNSYRIKSAKIDISADKVLQGRDDKPLAEDEFSFTLTSESGNHIYQSSNKADGSVEFKDVIIEKAGTHRFTLAEVRGTDSQITYDDKLYPVIVEAIDNGDGTLTTKVISEPVTLTNTYVSSSISIPVTKNWEDGQDQDGKRRPVTVHLYADGADTGQKLTLTAENNWRGSFVDVPAERAGREIVYTVSEEPIDGYIQTSIDGDAQAGFTITNSRTPETITINAKKNWDDGNNQDGRRPSKIILRLLADGVVVAENEVSPSADGQWVTSFENRPKYQQGREITYTIDEVAVAEYTTTINDFTVTNSRQPAKVDYEVTKVWSDNGNQDGKRPDSIRVQLYKSVGGSVPTVVEGNVLTLSSVDQRNSNVWVSSFKDLPKYDNGQEITYSVKEDTTTLPAGYQSTVSGQTITNSYQPETVRISGIHTWEDFDNKDKVRPDTVTVDLLGENDQVIESKQVSSDLDGNWTFDFDNLPKYSQGQEIPYQINVREVAQYTTKITEDNQNKGQYHIEHKYDSPLISIDGQVRWIDDNNKAGKRPDTVTITLLANGKAIGTTTTSAMDGWLYKFSDLERYQDGSEITYSISATAATDYKISISGFVITELYQPTDIQVPILGTTSDTPSLTVPHSSSDRVNSASRVKKNQTILPKTGEVNSVILWLFAMMMFLLSILVVRHNVGERY